MKLFDDFKKELDEFVEQSKTRKEKSTLGKLAGQLKTEFSNEIGDFIERVDKRTKEEREAQEEAARIAKEEQEILDAQTHANDSEQANKLSKFIPIDSSIIEGIKDNVDHLVDDLKENVDDFMEDAQSRKEKSLLGRIAGQISSNILYEVDEIYKDKLKEENPFVGQKIPTVRHSSPPPGPNLNPRPVYISDEYRNKIIKNEEGVWEVYQGSLIDCEHNTSSLQILSFDRIHSARFLYCNNCHSVLYGSFQSPSDNHSYPSVNYIDGQDFSRYDRTQLPRSSEQMNDTIENLIPQSQVMS
ncbi:MAG: hypothetical protein KC646_00050 [Candidatus Cloacimonetes bacterium]|nr:hypothetical protein [Candidatus Cloacimonadota bacterium]